MIVVLTQIHEDTRKGNSLQFSIVIKNLETIYVSMIGKIRQRLLSCI